MGIGREYDSLYIRLNYKFKDITYLEKALTHSSYTNEMRVRGSRVESNESLEFLGDAVLQLVISEELFDRYKKKGEGILTKYRQTLVCEKTLAKIAAEIELGKYLNVGKGEESTGLRERPKVLADALEAVIAAVYLDDRENANGAQYRRVIFSLFENELACVEDASRTDYKTILQQFVEKNGDAILTYSYEESGPEHLKLFTATAYINNNRVGVGSGRTKIEAEMQAAKAALKLFGIF